MRLALQQRRKIEFAGAIEAADRLRDLLAEQPIGAHDARQAEARAARRGA